MIETVGAVLVDLDGVLYVEDEPIAGAREAVERLRAAGLALRFVTNTTARSRSHTFEKLDRLGFDAGDEELVTPAALAVLSLDVGPFVAALEYATGPEA